MILVVSRQSTTHSIPVNVVLASNTPASLKKRGILLVDWKWWNDTDDIVRDLVLIADTPRKRFAFTRLDPKAATFSFEAIIAGARERDWLGDRLGQPRDPCENTN